MTVSETRELIVHRLVAEQGFGLAPAGDVLHRDHRADWGACGIFELLPIAPDQPPRSSGRSNDHLGIHDSLAVQSSHQRDLFGLEGRGSVAGE